MKYKYPNRETKFPLDPDILKQKNKIERNKLIKGDIVVINSLDNATFYIISKIYQSESQKKAILKAFLPNGEETIKETFLELLKKPSSRQKVFFHKRPESIFYK